MSSLAAVLSGTPALISVVTHPSGLVPFTSITWDPPAGGYVVGVFPAAGVLPTSPLSVTLQLATGYGSGDIAIQFLCWIVTANPSTNSITVIVANGDDPTNATDKVLVSWAVVE